MRVQMNYKYKNYPYAPSLTKKSQTIGKLTTPLVGLVLGALMGGLTMMLVMMSSFSQGGGSFEMAYVIAMVALPCEIILALVLMPVIRNALFKKLDKQYIQMMSGKIPLK